MVSFFAHASGLVMEEGKMPIIKMVGHGASDPFFRYDKDDDPYESEIYVSAMYFGLLDIGRKKFKVTIEEVAND